MRVKTDLLLRAACAAVILAVTMLVSVVWQRMVYTIPVLAVLLFFAADLNTSSGPARRNVDEEDGPVGGDGD